MRGETADQRSCAFDRIHLIEGTMFWISNMKSKSRKAVLEASH